MDEGLRPYATAKQLQLLDCIAANGGHIKKGIAQYGCTERVGRDMLARLRKAAAKQGWSPEHGMTRPVPEGFHVKGTSTYYDEDGNIRGQWVKSQVDREHLETVLESLIEGALGRVQGKAKKTKAPKTDTKRQIACYQIGDAHLGMRAYHRETGENHDLAIGEADLRGAFKYLVDAAPKSETALIAQFGDFFHMDDDTAQTPTNHHRLDVDGRTSKVVDVGIDTLRFGIELALQKHKKVIVECAPGNHDPKLTLMLRKVMLAYFSKEPRVEIVLDERPTWYMPFGKCLVGITHGHAPRPEKALKSMAVRAKDHWHLPYKYLWHGHIHNKTMWEDMGVLVESFRTLASTDKWHTEQGYYSGREMQCTILDAEYGEVARNTCGINLARAA